MKNKVIRITIIILVIIILMSITLYNFEGIFKVKAEFSTRDYLISYFIGFIAYLGILQLIKKELMDDIKYKLVNRYGDDVQIMRYTDTIVALYSLVHLSQKDIKTLELCINSSITEIIQDNKRKNVFILKHEKGKDTRYRSMPPLSLERLEAILIWYKDKPHYIDTHQTQADTTHVFTSKLGVKKLTRLLPEITHRWGGKKNQVEIEFDKDKVLFSLKNLENKIYYLDELIDRVKVPGNCQLPFILGVNVKNATPVVADLTETKHLLIGGKTGSGKSSTFECIIESMMYLSDNLIWMLLDFNESAFVKYEHFSNCEFVEPEFSHVKNALHRLTKEYKLRRKLFRENNVINIQEYNETNNPVPYIVLAVDEANSFKDEMTKDEFQELDDLMGIILKKGRKYGIFTIHAVQRSQNNDYSMSWKTQMTKVCHMMTDFTDCFNLCSNRALAEKMLTNLSVGEFYLTEHEEVKLKGLFRDKEHQKTYQILKEAYEHVKKVVDLEKQEKNTNSAKKSRVG